MPIKLNTLKMTAVLSVSAILTACGGDDGDQGPVGEQGAQGESGLQSLIAQTAVSAGNEQCFQGGVRIDSGVDDDNDGTLAAGEVDETSYVCHPTSLNQDKNFNRIASFLVCSQFRTGDCDVNPDTDEAEETAAEIVAASVDGMTLVYTDSPQEQLGFVDITNPADPQPDGILALAGEPTSVAVKGNYAIVGVNSSADFVNVGGHIDVINMTTQTSVRNIDLGGQPDSVAVSPDGNYAAVVIENERDEDLGDGVPPQLPAGTFVIADISDVDPANWTTSTVDITGVADLFPSDPEPEYVDINENNIAVITLQENNHIILVDLTDGSIVNDFSAGDVDLTNIDTTEEEAFIDQSESQDNVVREPDGVAWINTSYFATADEGDMDGGSRGFTVFDLDGNVVWNSGSTLDHLTARFGHYPDERSGNKGNEPENAEVGVYGSDRYLFVNSERSSLVFVYDAADPKKPIYKQTLPAGAGPEGALAIPSRNLLVVASEEDAHDDKIRSVLNIYSYAHTGASYPTLVSSDRENGTPIPFAAMSGLSADPNFDDVLYAVEDSFFLSNRIFEIQVKDDEPAVLTREIRIMDSDDVFAAATTVDVDDALDDDDAARIDVFDDVDLAAMINADKTVNIDPEGVAKDADGGFWVVSEGSGTVGDAGRPVNSLNFLFKTDAEGVIEDVVTLPSSVNDIQLRFGFEGVTVSGTNVYVAFQRAWGAEANPRIGIYDTVGESWTFVFYPLDAPASQNGGWVGLSDITAIGGNELLVLERDNQGGPDAAIKRIYRVDLTGLNDGDTIGTKTLVRDLMGDLAEPGGLIAEKVEGMAVTPSGDVYIINDNDGVDDNSGETQLINLGDIVEDDVVVID